MQARGKRGHIYVGLVYDLSVSGQYYHYGSPYNFWSLFGVGTLISYA